MESQRSEKGGFFWRKKPLEGSDFTLQQRENHSNEALAEAKIKVYSWHCNRHTFASRLVMAGVDLRTVAELMGHSSVQMTMRYAHLAPQHNRAAVDRLVSVSMLNRSAKKGEKSSQSENGVVTKSVTGRKQVSSGVLKKQNNSNNSNVLQ